MVQFSHDLSHYIYYLLRSGADDLERTPDMNFFIASCLCFLGTSRET